MTQIWQGELLLKGVKIQAPVPPTTTSTRP
jgi:hypothetical protein